MATKLPQLAWHPTPNESARLHGFAPYLIVVHRPAGNYRPSIDWLCSPKSQASAHVITEGNGTGVDVATQLVAWDRKAWHACAFNSASYGIEVDDDAWTGADPSARRSACRIVAYLSSKTGIPIVHSKDPLNSPGVVRHYDLGVAGGGHTDPTSDLRVWRAFLRDCVRELDVGGFRKTWGRGRLVRIKSR